MTATFPFEILIMPKTTYILFENQPDRRIYTDGREWPQNLEPAFAGYSIGHWERGARTAASIGSRRDPQHEGPRDFDTSGLPVHEDNQTVVMEKLYLDKANKDLLHDEVTTIDHALTRPWTVTQELPPRGAIRSGSTTIAPRTTITWWSGKGELFSQRRRPADAGQERPAAARFAVFQAPVGLSPVARVKAQRNAGVAAPDCAIAHRRWA